MHMADALLAPAVAATMYAASAVMVGASVKTLRKDEATAKLPTMAVTSALVFAGQMINYTIPGTGSSGHLCGGMLLSALLGPQAGFLSMVVIPHDSMPFLCGRRSVSPWCQLLEYGILWMLCRVLPSLATNHKRGAVQRYVQEGGHAR